MSDKAKFPRAAAIEAAREICGLLTAACERLIVAGSLRRMKAEVGDIEIVYIPKLVTVKEDWFALKQVSVADRMLDKMLAEGVIEKRFNVLFRDNWGRQNKYAIHCASGIPVDFFETAESAWFNYLVCRTGGAENNVKIAQAAERKGWKWHPYGNGFHNERGESVRVGSERDVFDLVGLPFLEPKDR